MQGEARVDWSSSWVGSRWLVVSGFVFDLGQRRSGLARDDFRMVLDVVESSLTGGVILDDVSESCGVS